MASPGYNEADTRAKLIDPAPLTRGRGRVDVGGYDRRSRLDRLKALMK